MSVEWLTWAFKQNVGDPGAKFVLVVIADHAGKSGFAWPSQEQISRYTDQTDRTVRKHLKALEAAGFISRKERRRDDGRKSSTGYQLITSPEEIAGETSPEKSSGLHRKSLPVHIEEPPSRTVKETPKPPYAVRAFNIEHHLTDLDWSMAKAAAGRLDVYWLAREFDVWVLEKGIVPKFPLKLFLNFISGKTKGGDA